MFFLKSNHAHGINSNSQMTMSSYPRPQGRRANDDAHPLLQLRNLWGVGATLLEVSALGGLGLLNQSARQASFERNPPAAVFP